MINPAKTWSSASHITHPLGPLQIKKWKKKEKEKIEKEREGHEYGLINYLQATHGGGPTDYRKTTKE